MDKTTISKRSGERAQRKSIFDEDKGRRTGQLAQPQDAPQPQLPEVEHPQSPMLIIGLGFGGLKFKSVV